ncbi:MAG: hypothetical protein R3314_03245 [Longimicrobiales bacterium]|nr:hypothetical protein [Longimicrobiales bacterium]
MRPYGSGPLATVGLTLLLAAGWAAPSSAQWTAELRVGSAIGNYTATEAGLDIVPSLSVAAAVELAFTDLVSGYAGINRSAFGCNQAFCAGRDVSISSRGLTAGVRLAQGTVWGRAGLAVQALRVESDALAETTDPGIGWEVAAGVDIPVGRGFRVRPGLTFLRHSASTADADGHAALLVLDVGVAMRL